MSLNSMRARKLLKEFDFRSLFIDEMGWDRYQSALELVLSDRTLKLVALAHKRGMVAYHCPTTADEKMPDYALRRKIEHQVAKNIHEHFIVFTDNAKTTQIWQWVRREPGKPTACREHIYHVSQPGDALLQKLETIAFSLDEEDKITLPDVTGRARAAFDVERVTKRFYDQFQKEHAAFLKFITGIPESGDHEWYTSVMLNRLMFVYFLQRKGFLDGDRNYLRNRLAHCREEKGHDKFYSFYRYFLLRLFHEGLGAQKRDAELEKLVGRVPYLNGGIFDEHELERPDRYGKAIQIPDKAFERIFDYFDEYQWHLDERPLRADNEINPDVLGYIFEKYINQKQMGAYYTKEDITQYISKNTVIPFIFDAAKPKCNVAFDNTKGPTLWDLLRETPDRYIYPAVLHGMDKPLPKDIVVGLGSISKRNGWNKPAPADYALPTETWREIVARRQRCEDVRRKLTGGEVRDINDLITLNLDVQQFAQDAIESSEGPELLRAFWHSIESITILDPTCGSGAFLFAALNILEPLYEACLDRMEAFVQDLDRLGETHRSEKFSDFRKILERVAAHPNRRYFIFKNVILYNLFGVDMMLEAVEICKLRLFLKLAAQVEPDFTSPNLGIEPLPDIDFNIRAGNTLVGYVDYDEVKKAVGNRLDFENAAERIETKATDLQQAFVVFRRHQTEPDTSAHADHKVELGKLLKALDDELNQHLASEYGVRIGDRSALSKWKKIYQPFHWFIEFHGIMRNGGFDVVIGNPPYILNTPENVSYRIKESLFKTFSCKNLYAFVYERSLQLAQKTASLGLIVQLTALSSGKMSTLQDLLLARGLLVAPSFPRRPQSIFDGVEMPVTILVSRAGDAKTFTSRISRFYTEERPAALNTIAYTNHDLLLHGHRIGKVGSQLEVSIFRKLERATLQLASLMAASKHLLYYQEACRYWAKSCKGLPFFRRNGERIAPPHGRTKSFVSAEACAFAACLLNSTLFYWFYSAFSDCEHINDALLETFRVPTTWNNERWIEQEKRLAHSLSENSTRKKILTKQGHKIEYDELNAAKSKVVFDEIDCALARQYGFTDEELDFIINYDIKYRMGRDHENEAEQ